MSTAVYIKRTSHGATVVVMGLDSRMVQSAESYIKSAVVKEIGEEGIDDRDNPRGVPTPDGWSYMGFEIEEEGSYLQAAFKAVMKEAKRISWVDTVEVVRQWPRHASLRTQVIRLAAQQPKGSVERKALLDVLKASALGLARMKDGGRMMFSTEGVYAHVWFDKDKYAEDDFGRRNDDAVEWQVIISTSEDPFGRNPKGRELARKTFRSVEKRSRGQVQSMAEDFIKSSMFKYRGKFAAEGGGQIPYRKAHE